MESKTKSKKTNNSSQYVEKEGAIAFLDILGFKGIWGRQSPEEIFEIIKDIESKFDLLKREINAEQMQGIRITDITFISDTLVIEAEGNDFEKLMRFLSIIIQGIFLVFLRQKLPLRGAVSFGRYYRRKNIFMGPAVDDAAEWYEKAN